MTEKSSFLSLDGCGKSLFALAVVGLRYLSLDCVCATVVEWEAGGSYPVDTAHQYFH